MRTPFNYAHAKLYVLAPDGEQHRVHDAAYGPPLARPFQRRVLPLGDRRATVRYFVSERGVQRIHEFTRGETRALDPEQLLRQLDAAGYASTMPIVVPDHPW